MSDRAPRPSRAARWAQAAAVWGEPRVLIFGPLGFSAGLPLLLVFGTLSAWLERAEVARSDIGLLSLVALPYALKFLWAPLLDRDPPAFRRFGRRRGWMLIAQIGVAIGLAAMAISGPSPESTLFVAIAAAFTAFASASQDIAIDAYRIEAAPDDRQAACAAAYVTGYRIGMLIAGSWGALHLAGAYGYPAAYAVMAVLMVVGMATALIAAATPAIDGAEPLGDAGSAWLRADRRAGYLAVAGLIIVALGFSQSLRDAIAHGLGYDAGVEVPIIYPALLGLGCVAAVLFLLVKTEGPGAALQGGPARLALWARRSYSAPMAEFFVRNGAALALFLLAIMLAYRISDLTLGVMANPFYLAIGYSEADIANVAKLYGFIALLVGGFFGGIVTAAIGVTRSLLIGAALVAATNLGFALLASVGEPDLYGLAAVITADNFSAGMATTAFVAFLSSLTERAHAATQYALFSSIMLLLGKILASTSGFVQEELGEWPLFFIYCAALGLPAIALCAVLTVLEGAGRLRQPGRAEA